eukprot:SAG22_NODE_1014_length_6027_cov_3.998988_11_plen_99_part_00
MITAFTAGSTTAWFSSAPSGPSLAAARNVLPPSSLMMMWPCMSLSPQFGLRVRFESGLSTWYPGMISRPGWPGCEGCSWMAARPGLVGRAGPHGKALI